MLLLSAATPHHNRTLISSCGWCGDMEFLNRVNGLWISVPFSVSSVTVGGRKWSGSVQVVGFQSGIGISNWPNMSNGIGYRLLEFCGTDDLIAL